jgi:hemerythrin-like domain-containing protein
MKVTDQLKDEHQGIKLMLQILEKICTRVEAGNTLVKAHHESIVEFFRIFVDKCHHGKEEDLLFPAIIQAGIPKEGGPISVILTEHQIVRGFLSALGDAVSIYPAQDSNRMFLKNANDYIDLLIQHMDREDTILYPLADHYLPQDRQNMLVKQCEDFEHTRIGPGRHKEFHRLLDHLKAAYL